MNAQHWIAGTWTGTPTQPAIDPAIGEPIGLYADGGAAEADAAIAAARAVFDRTTWAQDARLRQNVLLDWATALDAKRAELATLMARENGKAIAQAHGEIGAAISEVRYYAGLARHLPGMAAAADSMKKLSLELGGKSCCVVFDDADVAAIAPRAACSCMPRKCSRCASNWQPRWPR